MKFFRKCNHQNNNVAVLIAVYCSMPWMFSSNAHTSSGHHSALATILAISLVLAAGMLATFFCRSCRTQA